MDCRAKWHPSAPHRGRRGAASTLGIAASHQALVRARIDPVDVDLVVCATATPDRTFPSTAVNQSGLGVTKGPRSMSGRVLRFRLRARRCRQLHQDRPVQPRPRHRRRDLADSGLDGPLHVRAVRRWRGSDVLGSRSMARATTGASCRPSSGPMAASDCFMWMAARARRRPWAICA